MTDQAKPKETTAGVKKVPLAETKMAMSAGDQLGVPSAQLIALIKHQVISVPDNQPPASDAELAVVLGIIQSAGLNPLAGDVYAWRDNKGKLCVQVSPDGWAKTANRGFSSMDSASPVNEPSKLSVYLVSGVTGTVFKRAVASAIKSVFTPRMGSEDAFESSRLEVLAAGNRSVTRTDRKHLEPDGGICLRRPAGLEVVFPVCIHRFQVPTHGHASAGRPT